MGVRFAAAAKVHGNRVATRIRGADGWTTRTFTELATDVRRLAARLVTLGVQPGHRVAIFSVNRPEWTVADLACLSVRAISVPLYPTSTPDQVRHILRDSGTSIAIVEGAAEVAKITEVWDDLPGLTRIITFEALDGDDPRITTLSAELAGDGDSDEVDRRLAAASADEVCTLIYTSGTTGDPKGVMLASAGFTHQLDVLERAFRIDPDVDHSLCFLPLSHAFERAWTYVVLSLGCRTTYCPDPRQVAELLAEVQPTLLCTVPRLIEKVYVVAHQKVAESSSKQAILAWALRVGAANQHAFRKGKQPSAWWRAQLPVADRLVLGNIRHALGGRKTVMACGGAPLRKELEEFLSACGVMCFQGYGMTEASPLISFPQHNAFKFGSCGRVLEGGEVRIGADGEILYRGPNVMKGYWNNPEATAATITDGWLHTGDVGHLDADGYLVITDRIKDLIITSNGKNIAPQPIEGLLLADPLFEYAVLLGDNRPYLTLLVSPSLPMLESLATQLQVAWEAKDDLFNNPAIVAEIKRRVAALTAKLPSHEQIKDLRVALEEFTLDNGLLTPTLKVKRKEVEKRFAELIEGMYSQVRRVTAPLRGGDEPPAA